MSRFVKRIVTSPFIYKPAGPYSHAVVHGNTVYVSGLLGLDARGRLVEGGAVAQARQTLVNLRHVLTQSGATSASVVKTTLLLANMDDFKAVNGVYAEFFTADCPARTTLQAEKLPLGAAVVVDAVAIAIDGVETE